METQIVIALLLAIPVILFPAVFVWYLTVGGIKAALRVKTTVEARAAGKQMLKLGAIVLALAPPVAIWYFLGGLGWQVALAVTLAVPIMLIGVAFVWYLQASGLYQVIRQTRQREKARAAMREAKEVIRV